MTLSTTPVSSGPYTGDGSVDTYAYNFKIQQSSQIKVVETTAAGIVTTLIEGTNYSVTGAGAEAGGTVVRTAGNLPTSATWLISRVTVKTQAADFPNQGDFTPQSHEDAFDKAMMIAQEIGENTADIAVNTLGVAANAADIANLTANDPGGSYALLANLLSVDNAKGAALIGLEDAAGHLIAVNVEAAIAELAANAAPVPLFTVKNVQKDIASNTVAEDDNELVGIVIPVAAKWYKVRCNFKVLGDGGGFRFLFAFTSTPQEGWGKWDYTSQINDYVADAVSSSFPLTAVFDFNVAGPNNNGFVTMEGMIKAHATVPGTFSIQWAQKVSDAVDSSLYIGSYVELTQMD